MKNYFYNSVSDRSKVKRICTGGGKIRVNQTGEVMTVSELVAMMDRGQDVSAYTRSVIWGPTDEHPNHGQVDLNAYQSLDFSERADFVQSHKNYVDSIDGDIKERERLDKEEVVRLATEKLRKETEETSVSSPDAKTKKASKTKTTLTSNE